MESLTEIVGPLWNTYLNFDEWIGMGVGLFIVYCLIREYLLAWPLGVLYVLISIAVLYTEGLYSNLALHVFAFLPLNLYGWYSWVAGKEDDSKMPVTKTSSRLLITLLITAVAGIVLLSFLFSYYFDAYRYDDPLVLVENLVTVLSLQAMWLQARKKLETWIFWFVVNIFSIGMYAVQEIWPYALLYSAYLLMAVWGYVAWSQSMANRR